MNTVLQFQPRPPRDPQAQYKTEADRMRRNVAILRETGHERAAQRTAEAFQKRTGVFL